MRFSLPTLVGTYFDGGEALGVGSAGDRLYVADNMDGVEILDVSNPARPVKVASHPVGGVAHDLTSDGTLIYVAAAAEGLVILAPPAS
jgi:hypothetical protein